jgi:coproporphyrinogen III oxidase-like Fe-S oxidoreductase
VLGVEEQLRRELILQLKLGRVSTATFREKFDVDLRRRFGGLLAAMEAAGWSQSSEQEVRLTRTGLLRADWSVRHFYLPEHRNIPYA